VLEPAAARSSAFQGIAAIACPCECALSERTRYRVKLLIARDTAFLVVVARMDQAHTGAVSACS